MLLTAFISLVLLSVINCEEKSDDTKIIIDNDAGADDAMAIFLALLYEKYNGSKLIGLTTVNGNTAEENVYVNNQRILKIINRQDVPIYRGSKSSLVVTPSITDYFGKDGLGDTGDVYTDLLPAQKNHAVLWLIKQAELNEGKLIVLAMGPLTNIALAIKLDPFFLGRLAHLYVGGGHIHNEENSKPEFNAHTDVEAYHIIVQNANPDKVTVVPFSQIKASLNFSKIWREEVLGAIDTDIMKALNKFERISLEKEKRWHALDPAVVAVAFKPNLVQEYRYSKNDMILCSDKRGINTNTFLVKENSNVRVVYSIDEDKYKKFLIDVFSNDVADTPQNNENS